ncbi:MAG: peptidoglycan editing factor PgeF [Bacteroidota bacterium]
MTIISSELLQATDLVTCGISTRHGGVSPEPLGMNLSFNVGDAKENVQKNRELFFQLLNIGTDRLAIPMQVHSNTVRIAPAPGNYPACDGLITNVSSVYLCVSVADCVPIFIVDTARRAVAAIHAGWRGIAARIVRTGVEMMAHEFDCSPANMVAYVGPSASACCYTVGEDVAGRFSSAFVKKSGEEIRVDLKAATVAQLLECSIHPGSIEVSPHCTIDARNLLHSYRRDKERSGRMMGVIGLREQSIR